MSSDFRSGAPLPSHPLLATQLPRRPSATSLIRFYLSIAGVVWVGGCAETGDWDAVVALSYSETALRNSVKRRFHLHGAGVPLRGDLSVDKVWTDVMGYTFVSRTPGPDAEAGILSLREKRVGVPIRSRGRGIDKLSVGRHELAEGYHIVDVFTPGGRYAASAVAALDMPRRRILLHLGLTKEHSESIDRTHLAPQEIVRWRSLMPVVVANRGLGYLYTRTRRGPGPASAAPDSMGISAQRYELEEEENFVLIGRDREGESYRHVFGVGGEYLMSAIQYGESPLRGRALLEALNLEPRTGVAGSADSADATDPSLSYTTEQNTQPAPKPDRP